MGQEGDPGTLALISIRVKGELWLGGGSGEAREESALGSPPSPLLPSP